MRRRFLSKSIWFIAAVTFLVTAVSCSDLRIGFRNDEKIVFTCDRIHLSEPEVRLIAAHYGSLFDMYYQDLIGEDFWSETISEGMDYEDYVRQYYVQNECKLLSALNAMAAKDKTALSKEEEERLRSAASETYAEMSEEIRTYTQADEENVLSLLKKYETAKKVIGSMLEGEKIGISEEASRVADIQVIRMVDKLDADDVYNRILHNENFLTLARAHSVDETIDYSVSKSDLSEPFHSIVFSMKEGDISEMIEAEGSFYIIRLTNSYNTLLSMKNSANLLAKQKYEIWSGTLESFMEEHPVGVVRQNFEEITLRSFTGHDAFQLFKYFN